MHSTSEFLNMDVTIKSDPDGPPFLEVGTEDKYFKKYQAMNRRCAVIQKENEMLINRTYRVKKLVCKLKRERKFLMDELDKRGDNYRNLPLTIALDGEDKGMLLSQLPSLPSLGRPRSSAQSCSSKKSLKKEKPLDLKPYRSIPSDSKPTSSSGVSSSGFIKLTSSSSQEAREPSFSKVTSPGSSDQKQISQMMSQRWNSV